MKRQSAKLGFSLAATLAAISVVCAFPGEVLAAEPGVSGVVRDTHGTPQVGAVVELLRPDASIVSRVFTDRNGRFSLLHVQPGTYSVEAIATAFLPALRQNLRIRANTVVNLTLSTLFEAAQWLPAESRPSNEPHDDWTWTLRSSANRPLLRMLDSGPLVLVDGDSGRVAATRTRVTLSSGVPEFGEGNLRSSFEIQHSTDDSRQIILRARLSGGGTAAFDSVAAYRREVAPGNVMRTVVAIEDQPDIRGPSGSEGMQSLVLRSSETLRLFNHLVADAGNEFQAVQLGRINVASHPFAGVTWTQSMDGGLDSGLKPASNASTNSVSYRIATSRTAQRSDTIDDAETMRLPVSVARGTSQIEHGLHQQVSVEHKTAHLKLQVAAFHDHLINPVVSGGGKVKTTDADSGGLLLDPSTGLMRVAGQSYSGSGVIAEASEQISDDTWLKDTWLHDTWIKIQCADGSALSLRAVPAGSDVLAALEALRLRNVQVYSISLTGNLRTAGDRSTGTQWRASYRWQPADTVTAVAPFENSPEAAYFSVFLRQPVHFTHILPNGVDALVDVRNLLAQGYRPFVTADGSTLYLAQAERSIQAGLSFSF